jgi:GH25 family lysozyme M1 (1,4-beta-N-acetylmuramidase)
MDRSVGLGEARFLAEEASLSGPSHPDRAPSLGRLLRPVAGAILIALLVSVALSEAVLASSIKAAACDGVNLRTRPTTLATRKATLKAGTRVTVTAGVSGGSWRASCNGKIVSGAGWWRISAVNGRSVASLYGVSYVYGAGGLFKAVTVPVSKVAACDGVNLRTSATTTATRKATINFGASVSVVATVTGGSWSTTCGDRAVSGTGWYRISAVNGKSTAALYGVTYVYGATGLFAAPGTLPAPTPTPTPTPPPLPGPNFSEGIDVSHWQNVIDWPMVRAAGKRFAYIKASESTDFVDWMYATNKAQAKAAGLYVGAYHFAGPDATPGDAVAEADHFLATAALGPGELLPVLDLEKTGGLSTLDLQAWVAAYLDRIYQLTGVRGVIYVSPSFWTNYMGDATWFATNGYRVLWIAHWTTSAEPIVPAGGWGGNGWTFWQYTSDGAVPGITGRVDLNRYKGTDFTSVLTK